MDNSHSDLHDIKYMVFSLFVCFTIIYLYMGRSSIMNAMIKMSHSDIEKYCLDFASALVDIYYHGYLKVVLPDMGTEEWKGIQERIKHYKNYEDLSDEVFPVHKLFLLIPSSGYCGPDVSNYPTADGRIEWRRNLIDEPMISRSGVTRRTLQSTVYRIINRDGKRHVSVVMEAAACLRSVYEASKRNPVLEAFLPKIIRRFLLRLQQVLDEDNECKDKCEIIYCDYDSNKAFSLPDEIFRVISKNLNNSTEAVPKSEVLSLDKMHTNIHFKEMLLNKFTDWSYYIAEKYGLGYSSALADVYFYGYLQIVLPDSGRNDLKGIEDRINYYKAQKKLSDKDFPVHKLFLLVTSTGYCVPDISNYPGVAGRIKLVENLSNEPVMDRSGIKKRTYKTSVYKVYSADLASEVYVLMEAAPCLMQFYAASRINRVLMKFKKKIIKSFIEALQKLLEENEDCKHKCEIIYCSDDLNLPDEIIKRTKIYI